MNLGGNQGFTGGLCGVRLVEYRHFGRKRLETGHDRRGVLVGCLMLVVVDEFGGRGLFIGAFLFGGLGSVRECWMPARMDVADE